MMALGSLAATSSISMPPAAEAMNTSLARPAVEHNAEVELACDRQRLFDQEPLDFPALGAGLVGDQIHAEDFARQFSGFFRRLGKLDAAAFAAAPGVNLCLDDYAGRAFVQQGLGRAFCFLAAFDHLSARHRHSVLREDGLRLVLMYFHFLR